MEHGGSIQHSQGSPMTFIVSCINPFLELTPISLKFIIILSTYLCLIIILNFKEIGVTIFN